MATKKTLRWHYKKRKQQIVKGIQPQSIKAKILEKTLPEFKKREKMEGKRNLGSLEQPLENPYLDSKGFKLCKS